MVVYLLKYTCHVSCSNEQNTEYVCKTSAPPNAPNLSTCLIKNCVKVCGYALIPLYHIKRLFILRATCTRAVWIYLYRLELFISEIRAWQICTTLFTLTHTSSIVLLLHTSNDWKEYWCWSVGKLTDRPTPRAPLLWAAQQTENVVNKSQQI